MSVEPGSALYTLLLREDAIARNPAGILYLPRLPCFYLT